MNSIVDDVVTAPLKRVLTHVRMLKRGVGMPQYECPFCGRDDFGARGHVKTHITVKHKDKLVSGMPEIREAFHATEPEIQGEKTEHAPREAVVPPAPELPSNVTVLRPAPPVEPMPTPQPTAPSPQLLTVPLESVLALKGPVWWQNPGTVCWEPVHVSDLTVQVIDKEVWGGEVKLICSVEDNDSLWAVKESAVLEGQVRVLKLAPVQSSSGELGRKPEDGLREIKKPDYDYFGEERASAAERRRIQTSGQIGVDVERYAALRDAYSVAKREFEDIQAELRTTLMDYVRANGAPPENGRSGLVVTVDDFEVQISVTPGSSFVERDDKKIIEWVQEHGYEGCWKMVLDLEEWESLKREKGEDGKPLVPVEFVRGVETVRKKEDTERLLINPLLIVGKG